MLENEGNEEIADTIRIRNLKTVIGNNGKKYVKYSSRTDQIDDDSCYISKTLSGYNTKLNIFTVVLSVYIFICLMMNIII